MGIQRYCEHKHLMRFCFYIEQIKIREYNIKKQFLIIKHPETIDALRLIWMFIAPVKGLKAVIWTRSQRETLKGRFAAYLPLSLYII